MFLGRVNLSLNCLFNWTTDIIEAKVNFMVGYTVAEVFVHLPYSIRM